MSMKWEDKGLKSPLARAKGLGSSRSPVGHWIGVRVSAAAIAIVSIWFVWFLSQVIGEPHYVFVSELADPRNAIMMLLFIVGVFYHTAMGLREIIEDYIHVEWFKMIKLAGTHLFYTALGIACIFSVLKIAF
ncbi:MAG: succinate dehydrogenase, hydrophobic membrane anchor protein [Pseudomonadota bacterium]